MSIRLRFTLLYNAILALMLAIFSITLYSIQSQTTFDALKKDLSMSSKGLGDAVLRTNTNPNSDPGQNPNPGPAAQPPRDAPPPQPFEDFSGEQVLREIPEREIVRVLDVEGNLVASPFGRDEDALPLSKEGLQAAQNQQEWWETGYYQDRRMLIYTYPLISEGQVAYIMQVARPLIERDRSLHTLGTTLIIANLLIILVAFGIGWVFSGITLSPIHRIIQTARVIGEERDFARRVAYTGPQDEVGQLATTFNSMLARLQDAYQQVALTLEKQRNFVADVSHELRTPLTTLRGNLGLLQRTPPIPAEEQADILNDMVDESDRLIRLVNELLILARADAGRSLAKDPLAIHHLLEEVCRQAQQIDPERRITLDASPELAILGDRDAFKQVLLILLDNALKHSVGDITVSARFKNKHTEIYVEDHGEGIPPERLSHVFDRFYRGEDNLTISGFGLGLPIAKALIEGQGGEIEMISEAGKGSTVKILF